MSEKTATAVADVDFDIVELEDIPARAPLIRHSKWDSLIEKVLEEPSTTIVRKTFAERKQVSSLQNAAKRRGLHTLVRANSIFLSTAPIPVKDETKKAA